MSDVQQISQRRADHRRPARKSVDVEPITFSEETAARKLGVSTRQVQRYRSEGLISFFRVGVRILYDENCLREFIAKHRQSAAA